MKRVLLFVLMLVVALFTTQQMLAQEANSEKLTLVSAETNLDVYPGCPLVNAIDANYNTQFETISVQKPGTTVTVTLPEEVSLDKVKLYLGVAAYWPKKMKIQVSIDKETWTDIKASEVVVASVIDKTNLNNVLTFDAIGYTAKYVRMYIIEEGMSWIVLREFEVYKSLIVDERTISVSVNNSEMGSAYIGEAGVTEVENETEPLRLVAVPAEGYMFVNWTVNGEVVSTEASYVDSLEGDKEYVANFSEMVPYNISVSENDPTLGNAFIGYVDINEVTGKTEPVLIRSQAYSNCRFLNWTLNGEVVSTEPDFLCTIRGTHHYVANFEELPKYDISIISGNPTMGSVIEIDRKLYEGEEITLLAFPKEGYEFVNWTVNGNIVSISPEYTFTVNSEIEYVAHFQIALEKLDIVAAESSLALNGNSAVSSIIDGKYNTYFYSQYSASAGSTVTVTLSQESVIGRVNLYFDTYNRPSAAKIQASVDNKHWFDIEGTSFKGSEAKYHQKASSYLMSKYITTPVTAKYVRMYITSSSYQSMEMREFEVYAYPMDIAPRNISVSVDDATKGTVYINTEGVTSVTNNTDPLVLVTTPTNPSYKFLNWTLNGEVVSTDSHFYDVTNGDKAYIANFANAEIFDVKVSSADIKQGYATATKTGNVYEGEEIAFTATAGGGCQFVNWTINGEVVSTANPYEFYITEDVDIVANFTSTYSKLTNVPTIYINTEGGVGVTSKDDYVTAYVTVRGAENEEDNITEVLTEIKGRGNSTWGMAKKPYRLKFDEKIKFLGNDAKEKNWVLLANYADKTLMRNALAFETARNMFEFGFTPSVTFVDVVLNGENIGSYMLTDQVEVKKKRVPVTEQDETTTSADPEITGGYLIEVDGFADSEISWFKTTKGMKVTIKYPKDDEINSDQASYIANYTQQMENALFGTNYTNAETGWRKYIDEASMVDWYIACELFGNSDAWWSTYMYKERDDLFKFGPLWDFDIAFNNDDRLGDATQKLMRTYAHDPKTWIAKWCQDADFMANVKARWEEVRKAGVLAFMTTYIDNTAEYLQISQQNNFQVWNILNTKVYRELAARGSYAAEVEFLKNYVTSRVSFLDNEFGLSQLVFSVSAVSSDEEKGAVTISATEVEEGGSVTLTATAKPGYRFLNWTLKGKTVSTNSSCTIPVTANSEFVANFVDYGAAVQGASLEEKAFGIPADQLGFNGQTPFTLAFWIYFNEFNHDSEGTQFINIRSAADGWPASDWGYLWSMIANEEDKNDYGDKLKEGNWNFNYRSNGSNGYAVSTPDYVKFEPKKWYHVAMACGYTTNRTFALFVNGKKIASATAPNSLYSWKSSNVIMVGGPAFARAAIDGIIDEVRLYKKVLSEAEVKVAMEHIDTVTDETLIGYWDFETSPDDNNNLLSSGSNKELVACIYDVQTITEGTNKYLSKPFVFVDGYIGDLYDLYVTAISADANKGSVELSSNSVEKGSFAILTANPAEGYEFVNWTVNGQVVSTDALYQPTITDHTNFVANFEVASGIESVESSTQIKVAVLGDEIKLYGTTQGEAIAIYSANGMLFANAMGEDSVTTINTSAKGLLIIKVGEQVFKVVK